MGNTLAWGRRLLGHAEQAAEWALLLVLSLLLYAQLLVLNSAVLAIIFFVGVALVLSRLAFFASLPFMLRHVHTFVDIINTFVSAFIAVENVVIAVTDVIIESIALFTGDKPKPLAFQPFETVTYSQFREGLNTVAKECTAVDSVGAMTEIAVPTVISPVLCPVLRTLYPLPGMPRVASSLDWLSADPSPLPGGNNCGGAFGYDMDYFWMCSGIGLGYVVLEVVLPIMLISLFIISSGRPACNAVMYLVKTGGDAVAFGGSVVATTTAKVAHAYEAITDGVAAQLAEPPPRYTVNALRM